MLTKNHLIPLMFLCSVFACRPESVTPGTLNEAVESSVNPYILFGGLSSVSVGVIQKNTAQTFHFGYAFPGKNQSPTDSTIYPIGDLTQIFTATLIADLILEGKVRLNDSLDRHLAVVAPDFEGEKITIGQLVTHTAALGYEIAPGYTDLSPLEQAVLYKNFGRTDFDNFLKNADLPYLPGERYNYSRAGMGILGYVTEEISAQSWPDFLQERITGPLNMADTRNLERMNTRQFERLGEAFSTTQKTLTEYQWGEYRGAASLYATVRDMITFLSAEMDPLSSVSDAFLLTQTPLFELGAGNQVGMGWLIAEKNGSTIYHRSGTVAQSAFLAFDRQKQLGVVILAGTPDEESVKSIGWAVMDFLQSQ
ncbi:MAG: serine hydrolase domain-containing protein [Bacteroidia bacterium]